MKTKKILFYFLTALLTATTGVPNLYAGETILIIQDDFNRPNNPSLSENSTLNYVEEPLINAAVQNNRALLKGSTFSTNSFISATSVSHPIPKNLTQTKKTTIFKTTVKAINAEGISPNPRIFLTLKSGPIELAVEYDAALKRLRLRYKSPIFAVEFNDSLSVPHIDIHQDNILILSARGDTATASIYPAGTTPPKDPDLTLDLPASFIFIDAFTFKARGDSDDNFFVEFDDLELKIRDNQAPEVDFTLFPIGFVAIIKDADGILSPDGLDLDSFKVIVNNFLDVSSFVLLAISEGVIQTQLIDNETVALGFGSFFFIFPGVTIQVSICDQNGECASDTDTAPLN